VLCHDLYTPTQEFLQLGHKTAREPRAWIRSNVNQQIHVAVGSRVTARHGSKKADTPGFHRIYHHNGPPLTRLSLHPNEPARIYLVRPAAPFDKPLKRGPPCGLVRLPSRGLCAVRLGMVYGHRSTEQSTTALLVGNLRGPLGTSQNLFER
jgi:hypothetical protein